MSVRQRLLVIFLVAAAIAGLVVVEATKGDGDRSGSSAAPAATGAAAPAGDVPVLIGTVGGEEGGSLMSPAPNAPTRIVPLLDWDVEATSPLLEGRDCVAQPKTCHNGKDGINIAYTDAEAIPDRPVRGRVLSDTACEPDAHGASHCLNGIRLEGGRIITVRNDHRLANEPCLAPGERVLVVPGATAHEQIDELRALAKDKSGEWPTTDGIVTGSCQVSDAGLKRAGITRAQLACTAPLS